MITTIEFFNMSKEELLKVDKYGYRIEENKLIDSAYRVELLNGDTSEDEIESEIMWYENNYNIKFSNILKTISGEIAILFN